MLQRAFLDIVESVLKANWLKFTAKKLKSIKLIEETAITGAAYGATMNLFAMFFQVIVFIVIALYTSLYVTIGGLLVGVSFNLFWKVVDPPERQEVRMLKK